MILLKKIRAFIASFESNEFNRNGALLIGCNVLLVSGIFWYYQSKTSSLQSSLREIYRKEYDANTLLDRFKEVQKQSEEVNALLEKEKIFRIMDFFDDIVQKLNLSSFKRGNFNVSEESVLNKRYTEVTIQTQFQGINTKQLCDLLQAIEQKSRLYIKELSIIKTKGNLLIVALTIATLTAQTDTKKT